MLEMSYAVCDPSRLGRSSLSSLISKASRSVSSRMAVVTIKGGRAQERKLTYMKALIASIMLEDLSEETRAGLFLSAFFSEMGDSQTIVETFAKNHNLAYSKMQLKVEHGITVGTCASSNRLIDSLDRDIIVGNPNLFENGVELGSEDELPSESLRTVISHIIMIASKCITSPTVCIDNARRRMEAMCIANPVEAEWFLQDEVAERVAKTIKQNIIIRRIIVELVEAALDQEGNTNALFDAVSHAGHYLRGAGLTGFVMVCNFVVSAKAPILAKPAYRSEVEALRGLLKIFSTIGPSAPYIEFLGHTKAGLFSPAAFPELHAFAIGYAAAAHASMADYAISEAITARPSYYAGRVFASRGGGAPQATL